MQLLKGNSNINEQEMQENCEYAETIHREKQHAAFAFVLDFER